jgi:hypothetical protein
VFSHAADGDVVGVQRVERNRFNASELRTTLGIHRYPSGQQKHTEHGEKNSPIQAISIRTIIAGKMHSRSKLDSTGEDTCTLCGAEH